MLVCVNLVNELKIAHSIHIYFIVKNDNDALRMHPDAPHLRVMVQFFNLLHILVIPKNDLVFGPFWIITSSDQRHHILSVKHLYDSNTTVKHPLKLEQKGIALINAKTILSAHCDARLILVESQEKNLLPLLTLLL